MPVAAIAGLAGGALSGAGSAMGGKKAGQAADKQLALQQAQLNFGKELSQQGMGAWTPAANYWKSLLGGDKTAIQGAVGPSADFIRGSNATGLRQIASSMPAGGERNLALAQGNQAGYSQLGRLYAGVQPAAAGQLGQLSAIPLGAGVNTMAQGAPQVGAGLAAQQSGKAQAMQGAQGAGQLLYQGANKLGNRGSGGNAKGGGGGSSVAGYDPSWTAGA
jgi:hypothetical protein